MIRQKRRNAEKVLREFNNDSKAVNKDTKDANINNEKGVLQKNIKDLRKEENNARADIKSVNENMQKNINKAKELVGSVFN